MYMYLHVFFTIIFFKKNVYNIHVYNTQYCLCGASSILVRSRVHTYMYDIIPLYFFRKMFAFIIHNNAYVGRVQNWSDHEIFGRQPKKHKTISNTAYRPSPPWALQRF